MKFQPIILLFFVLLASVISPKLAGAQISSKAASSSARDVSPEAQRKALDDFQSALDDRWSYRHANRADFVGAISTLRKQIKKGIAFDEFGLGLQKILSLGIDGHSEVTGFSIPSGGHLPFLIEPSRKQFVAFSPDRTSFLADGFPYIAKIDGRPVADWCAAAAVLEPKGSPQFILRQCLRHLRDIDHLRGLMKMPTSSVVSVELIADDGVARKTLTLPVAAKAPVYGLWPRENSRFLTGNIGYLRLPAMNDDAVQEIKAWMPKFRGTDGLIVDVRDNGGGSRDALLQLYSYLAAPGDPPHVFTAAAYRLHPERKDDYLVRRYMYRADATQWTESERRAVAEFAKKFKPNWKLPKGQFSDWHYMALSRLNDTDVYHYSKPVIVLMNAKCFSATDIFLAGLKGMKQVTLLGTASGGGSALVQSVPLGNTPLRLRIGSMASFQADGRLFDGNGVRPDVVVEPMSGYYIGSGDNVLAEAINRIRKR